MKTHVIDGVTYVEVERKAEVGDKIVMIDEGDIGYDTGDIFVVNDTNEFHAYFEDNGNDERFAVQHRYRVLEPLEEPTVDTTQASPAVIDMLANLARRVTQLEKQLAATQRNLETFAEQTESIKYLAESNEQDIAMLDERTQVINVIKKFYDGERR